MKSKSFIFLVVLIFMMVFSLSAVSADDLQTTDSGEVSGDVDVVTVNPWNTSGELNYDISPGATEIKSANVYVNVYAGKATNEYGAIANVSLKTDKGESQIASEELWIAEGSADGTVYTVNNHTDKCYSDYQMRYDITDSLKGLNGSSIAIHVDTFKMDGKQFDGRIKLIALVLAYDDGDSDVISYWIDSNQKWTKTNVTTIFDTTGIKEFARAGLTNVALSSADGNFTLNGENLGTPDGHISGSYYQFSYWDVSDKIMNETKTEITAKCTGTTTYASLKNVLTVLKVMDIPVADVSFNTEYTSAPTCYAGTNNTLTVKVNANKAGRYTVYLTANGEYVTGTEIELDGQNANDVLLTDPTVRPINETTVNGANNTKVTYGVVVSSGETIIGNAMITVPVLYNGNLGYDMEYGVKGFEQGIISLISGDVVVDVKDDSTYLGASDMNRTDVWTVNIPEGSKLDDAFIIVPYNWFNSNSYDETEFIFNLTFNNNAVANRTMLFERDQGNLGKYAKYGYGVLVYDVADLIKTGENTLVLNKNYPTPAVYPSVLVYMYNTPGGTLKEVEITWGADLLANSYNNAGRIVKSDSNIAMEGSEFVNATLYVLAAGAQIGEGNIVFNGKEFGNVWNGTAKTTDLFVANITDVVGNNNNISFVATGSTILALPQIIVADTGDVLDVDSVKTEYSSVPAIYAGTNNTFTVTVDNSIAGEFEFYLYDISEGKGAVDHKIINLTKGINTILLTDPTIRPIDETTVSGANNTKVKYLITFKYKNYYYEHDVMVLPVLYNGYLGKDMAYNATYIENVTVIQVTGGVKSIVQNDTTYMGSAATNRTDILTVDLDEKSSLVKAFVYLAYNWDKSGANGPAFNVTFNGNTIVPKAHYRDQSNLGNSGAYGYGLFVYDVTDLALNGNNTLVIQKPKGLTAVYPSNLVYLYDTVSSGLLKTVYLADGADLMANSYNVAGRPVNTGSQIIVDVKDLSEAELFIFAAGAQTGEGNIIFNGIENVNVWNGTSNSVNLFTQSITSSVADSNNISFVATGSTILALNQMIVTSQDVPIKTTLTVKALSTTYDSGKAFTVKVLDETKKPVSKLTLTLKIYTGSKFITRTVTTNANGIASFASASKLAIGTHKVIITSTNKKYDVAKTTSSIKVSKAKTTVKAPKVTAKVKKSKYFKITVKNKATKKVVKSLKVKVKVYTGKKSKTYTVKTNSKGLAKLNTKSLKVGTHKVVITSGNAKYVVSAKSTIVIKK